MNSNKNRIVSGLMVVLILLSLLACTKGKEDMAKQNVPYKSVSDVPKEAWDKLSTKKVYFGHQSVGYNIVDGIRDVMKKNPQIRLNIIESSDLSRVNGGCFAHSRVGKNVDPESKIDGFAKFVEDGMGNSADIACFKFCFVDIHTGTNIDKVFNLYREKMDHLSNRFPKTNFVHMTVPLTSHPVGMKGVLKDVKDTVKSILGKINMYDNKVKYSYNAKLRAVYENSGRLFDLAASESTFKDGSQLTVKSGDKQIPALIPEYTDDGGHLDAEGRYKVAEDFLLFLVKL